MRKIYTPFIVCLFATLFINAQSTYHKMLKEDTTTWQHFGAIPGVSPNEIYSAQTPQVMLSSYAAIDSITISGFNYKKFYLLQSFFSSALNYSNKSLVGYLREDTIARKVYYRENASTSDMLLYDFSKNVGDSVYITFVNESQHSGFYRLDSIKTKNELPGPRKHFYYRKHIGNSDHQFFYLDNIEGIGSTYHIAYIFSTYWFKRWTVPSQFTPPASCSYWADIGLSCKHDDQVKQYQSCTSTFSVWGSHSDPCIYFLAGGGLKTNDWEKLVKIGPNPSSDQIEVSVDQSFADINCSVTDMIGKVVLNFPKSAINTEKNSFVFSSRDLAPGVYIVQVDLNGTLIKRPVIIQH